MRDIFLKKNKSSSTHKYASDQFPTATRQNWHCQFGLVDTYCWQMHRVLLRNILIRNNPCSSVRFFHALASDGRVSYAQSGRNSLISTHCYHTIILCSTWGKSVKTIVSHYLKNITCTIITMFSVNHLWADYLFLKFRPSHLVEDCFRPHLRGRSLVPPSCTASLHPRDQAERPQSKEIGGSGQTETEMCVPSCGHFRSAQLWVIPPASPEEPFLWSRAVMLPGRKLPGPETPERPLEGAPKSWRVPKQRKKTCQRSCMWKKRLGLREHSPGLSVHMLIICLPGNHGASAQGLTPEVGGVQFCGVEPADGSGSWSQTFAQQEQHEH